MGFFHSNDGWPGRGVSWIYPYENLKRDDVSPCLPLVNYSKICIVCSVSWLFISCVLMRGVWYVSLIIFGIVAGFFLGMVGVPAWFEWLNPLMICLIGWLTFVPLVRRHGRRAAWILFMLGLTWCVIEYLAIKTCFPYGCFVYSDLLGYKVLDTVPWTVVFAWSPLVVWIWTAFARFRSQLHPWQFFLLVTVFLVLCDVVLDPGAVHAWFWLFEGTYWWYNIPWTNFVWWVLSWWLGFIEWEWRHRWYEKKTGKQWELIESNRYAVLVMMVFWTTYAGVVGMRGAMGVGLLVLAVLAWSIVWSIRGNTTSLG